MENPQFVNQGTYGCVYLPNIPCKTSVPSHHREHPYAIKYISKVQVRTSAVMEINLGNILQTIPQYTSYFAPILQDCEIDVRMMDPEEAQKCQVIQNHSNTTNTTPFVSSKIRYIGSQSLSQYLVKQPPHHLEKSIFETHLHVLKALNHLAGKRIVHYDLKDNNIMYDEQYGVPILIDFGLSFQIDDDTSVNPRTYQQFYSDYEKYPSWPIECVFISYLTTTKSFQLDDLVPLSNLQKITDIFVHENEALTHIEDQEQCQQYHDRVLAYLQASEKETIRTFIDKLIDNLGFTWDNYAVAVTYSFYLLAMSKDTIGPRIHQYKKIIQGVILSFPSRPHTKDTQQAIYELATNHP